MVWVDSAEQTLVPEVPTGLGWGLEWLALVVHSKLEGLVVPQIRSSIPNIVVLARKVHGPIAVTQVVYRRL